MWLCLRRSHVCSNLCIAETSSRFVIRSCLVWNFVVSCYILGSFHQRGNTWVRCHVTSSQTWKGDECLLEWIICQYPIFERRDFQASVHLRDKSTHAQWAKDPLPLPVSQPFRTCQGCFVNAQNDMCTLPCIFELYPRCFGSSFLNHFKIYILWVPSKYRILIRTLVQKRAATLFDPNYSSMAKAYT